MASNILNVETHAQEVSLRRRRGGILLLDFKAAFPSVSHSYLWAALTHIGLPADWIRALKFLYVNNVHTVQFRGASFPGFTAHSGVRQGCPVSPLIFAIVVDISLLGLHAHLPLQVIRAFADDTAIVLDDFFRHAPAIESIC